MNSQRRVDIHKVQEELLGKTTTLEHQVIRQRFTLGKMILEDRKV